MRALGSVPIAEGGGETGIPLSGQNWTQAADELDQYAGYVMVSATGSCGSSPVTVTIRDNGNQIGEAIYGAPSPVPAPMRIVFTLYPALTERSFDTGAAQAHSLSATAKTTCTGGAVTLTQVVIDIVGVR